jgi:hypothetical protein
MTMRLEYDDGGRAAAGFKGQTGDCVTRAIAIATERPYQIYDAINLMAQGERTGKHKRGTSNARTGVYKQTIRKYMAGIGWKWTPTMQIGAAQFIYTMANCRWVDWLSQCLNMKPP